MTAPVQEKLRPSGVWYVVGGLVLAAGIIGGFVLLVVGIVQAVDQFDDFDRVPASQGGTVTLEAGDKTIYAEGPGVSTATSLSASDVEVLTPSGNEVDLSVETNDFTYEVDGRSGVAVLNFDAPTDGTYEIRSDIPSSEITTLAVGPNVISTFGSVVGWLVGAAVVGLVGLALGLVLLIVTGVRRGRAKKQRRLAAAGGGFGTPQGGYGQPGAYPPPPGAGVPPPGSPPGSAYPPPPPGS